MLVVALMPAGSAPAIDSPSPASPCGLVSVIVADSMFASSTSTIATSASARATGPVPATLKPASTKPAAYPVPAALPSRSSAGGSLTAVTVMVKVCAALVLLLGGVLLPLSARVTL